MSEPTPQLHTRADSPDESGRHENAIRTFLTQYFQTQKEERKTYGFDFDISAPRIEDMRAVQSGDYELRDFRVLEMADGSNQYHFYVGSTEFHITGKAAGEVSRLMLVQEEI